VIANADRKPASRIAADARRLADRAKERGLTADDLLEHPLRIIV